MKKHKQYRYIGRNGIITSSVLLEDIKHIPMLYLEADSGFLLTNGEKIMHSVFIEADELSEWYEIVDNIKKDN